MYVLLIHSAVFDRVVSRWRSSFVLLTNSFAEAGSDAASAEAGGAPWGGGGGGGGGGGRGSLGGGGGGAGRRRRAGKDEGRAAEREKAHGDGEYAQSYVFGSSGPVPRMGVSSSPARSASWVRRREARRSRRHSSRLMFCRTRTYACMSVW